MNDEELRESSQKLLAKILDVTIREGDTNVVMTALVNYIGHRYAYATDEGFEEFVTGLRSVRERVMKEREQKKK